MKYQLQGFMIGREIFFDVKEARIFRLPVHKMDSIILFGGIFLNNTMFRLLTYLMINAENRYVSRDELLSNVWEKYDLSASTQRLCKVVSNLNKKLSLLGLPADTIINVKGSGYIIRLDNIKPLYGLVDF
ncbi:winged helix-turn-helix domain-containing protein [Citrobacter portucalensis]|uniref:Helix-turn-helix domain-containing protein n=1 Tax=Citrobacter portucalensis TaxID=1639133 RepID=A0A9X4JNA3_9ENTR|nr:helix-turn-helix domain-containing protein [Citrobacter portucalensis]MDE9619517.1 helix-turn-helix domain-containing protein [Citrobacter portucalensis]